jgi:C8 domain
MPLYFGDLLMKVTRLNCFFYLIFICVQVAVTPYYSRCKIDYCTAKMVTKFGSSQSSSQTESETAAAVCQTLETYSQLCAVRHTTFSWRTAQLCREFACHEVQE